MKVLSGSSTTKIAPKTIAMTARSIRPAHARRGNRLGHHRLHRTSQRARRGGDVLELRLHVDHLSVEPGQLDPDRVSVELDRSHRPVELVLADPLLAQADGGGLAIDLTAYAVGPVGRHQHAERVRRAALLHQDRGQPGIARAGLEQRRQHLRPQPRVEVVDVGLQQHGRRLATAAPAVAASPTSSRSTLAWPSGSRPPAPTPDRVDRHRRLRSPAVGQRGEQGGARWACTARRRPDRRSSARHGGARPPPAAEPAGGRARRTPCHRPPTRPRPRPGRRPGGRTRRRRRPRRRSRPGRRPRGSARPRAGGRAPGPRPRPAARTRRGPASARPRAARPR